MNNYASLMNDISLLNPTIMAANETLRMAEEYVQNITRSGYQNYAISQIHPSLVSLNNTLILLLEQSMNQSLLLEGYRNEVISLMNLILALQGNASVEEGVILNASNTSYNAQAMVNSMVSLINETSMINDTLFDIEEDLMSIEIDINASDTSYTDLDTDIEMLNNKIINLMTQLNTLSGMIHSNVHESSSSSSLSALLLLLLLLLGISEGLYTSANVLKQQSNKTLVSVGTLMVSSNDTLLLLLSLLLLLFLLLLLSIYLFFYN